MTFAQINPYTLKPSFVADGYWLDWDLGSPGIVFLQALEKGPIADLGPVGSGDGLFCVLVETLKSIPPELLNDPRVEGILFIEKSQVPKARDGSYDWDKLFEIQGNDQPFNEQASPRREEWKLDHQGYLVLKEDNEDPRGPSEDKLDGSIQCNMIGRRINGLPEPATLFPHLFHCHGLRTFPSGSPRNGDAALGTFWREDPFGFFHARVSRRFGRLAVYLQLHWRSIFMDDCRPPNDGR